MLGNAKLFVHSFWKDTLCCGDRDASGAKPSGAGGAEGDAPGPAPLRPPPPHGQNDAHRGHDVEDVPEDPFFVSGGRRNGSGRRSSAATDTAAAAAAAAAAASDVIEHTSSKGSLESRHREHHEHHAHHSHHGHHSHGGASDSAHASSSGLHAAAHAAAGGLGIHGAVAAPPGRRGSISSSHAHGTSSTLEETRVARRPDQLSDLGSGSGSQQQVTRFEEVSLGRDARDKQEPLQGHAARVRARLRSRPDEDEFSDPEDESFEVDELKKYKTAIEDATHKEYKVLKRQKNHDKKGADLARDLQMRLGSGGRPSLVDWQSRGSGETLGGALDGSLMDDTLVTGESSTHFGSSNMMTQQSDEQTAEEAQGGGDGPYQLATGSDGGTPLHLRPSFTGDDSDDETQIGMDWLKKRQEHLEKLKEARKEMPDFKPELVKIDKTGRPVGVGNDQRKLMKTIGRYEDMMKNRLQKIGGKEDAPAPQRDWADYRQVMQVVDPAEAVVAGVLKYHQTCQNHSKFKAFAADDDHDLKHEDQKVLGQLIQRLEDDEPKQKKNAMASMMSMGDSASMSARRLSP